MPRKDDRRAFVIPCKRYGRRLRQSRTRVVFVCAGRMGHGNVAVALSGRRASVFGRFASGRRVDGDRRNCGRTNLYRARIRRSVGQRTVGFGNFHDSAICRCSVYRRYDRKSVETRESFVLHGTYRRASARPVGYCGHHGRRYPQTLRAFGDGGARHRGG